MGTSEKKVTITLTEKEHKELLALLLHYTTRTDKWAISTELRKAVLNDRA